MVGFLAAASEDTSRFALLLALDRQIVLHVDFAEVFQGGVDHATEALLIDRTKPLSDSVQGATTSTC